MNQVINSCLTALNSIGPGFCDYAADIFIQSSVLIILLLIIDFLLRKRVRAVFRYCLWMLVFIKLVMPASFTLPTGIGYWMGDYFPSEVSMTKWIPQTEEIVPTTLNIHQRSIPLEPVVTNGTAVIDIYQDLIPLEPVITNETEVTGIELEPICWQGLVFLGWLMGMLVLLALLVRRFYFVRGLIAQSRPANGRLLEMLDECRCLIGIRQNVELRLSGNRLSPADCGLFKPIILMPATLPEELSRKKLKAVLIHELAHIKRGDVWVNLVQIVLQIIYFYNPFVWLANVMVRRVREQAVDEMVLVTLKPETKSYSNMLIDIAEMAFWRPNFSLRIIGVVESKKALERRIKHMLSRPVPKSSKLGYLGLIAIVFIGAILLPMGSNSIAEAANTQKQSRVHSESNTIVPGVGIGDYTLGMSKDEVLRKLGEPEEIFFARERYTLDNLPRRYYMFFGDISFKMDNDTVTEITAISPYYKFTNGLGVGDSEQKIKQAFGDDFHFKGADFLAYEDEGLTFEIHKKNRTVMEINLYQPNRNQDDSTKALTPSPLDPYDNVCGKDLRTHDLRNAGRILDTLEFNQETLWPTPDRLPEGFDPKMLMQGGMNPGLGVRALHAKGITGAGVHVGLIDQPLLLDHPEYVGKIVSYHDTGCGPSMSSMHGPAMASQLVGNQCGTAPGANLHAVAVPSWKRDAEYYARALDRLVTRNREVRKDQKIRVVSVSARPSGEGSEYINQSLWDRAVQRAQANGILVLDCTRHHGITSICGLDPQDRESVESCTLVFRKGIVKVDEGHIHVPSAPRTVAEAPTERPYGYLYGGIIPGSGLSDTIPYTAGILALGWQIRPELTPAQMKEMLFASAYVHKSGARIINPRAFIDLVRNQSDNQQIRKRPQTYSETQTIVPGLRVGDYTLDMSKDDVLRKLGEPEAIQLGEDDVDVVRRGEERYSLNNLPSHYILSFGNISFWFSDDTLEAISVRSPLYKLSNGLGVGDTEQKIKQTFREDFHLEEVLGKDILCYDAKGLGFEIHKKNQTVAEIVVYQPEGDRDAPEQQEHSKHTIVPGVRVGDFTLDMSKDEVLRKLGEPESIRFGGQRYTLNDLPDNLPRRYIMSFSDFSFAIDDDSVSVITVRSPLYKFTNGLGAGDSEQEIKRAFGNDFQLEEYEWKNLLNYEDKGIQFEINKKNRTVIEIDVYQAKRNQRIRTRPQTYSETQTIVPGVRVGNYTLDMSKDEVLKKLGEPEAIQLGEDEVVRRGEEKYSLDNLPNECILSFGDISFWIDDDSVEAISVRSPLYKLSNGLKVGDSEQKIKQAFGEDFHLEEALGRTFLCKHAKGLGFEIHKKNQTVAEIVVYKPEGSRDDRDAPEQEEHSKHTIVPGLRVGEYTLGMSKDEVLKNLGEPGHIHFGGERYTLNNLPRRYIMSFGDISFGVEDDTVTGISVRSSLYKFTNGLGVGNSEQEIKRAFGSDFQLEEYGWKSQLNYENRGIQFEIRNKDKMVIEIDVYRAERDQQSDRRSSKDLSTLVRQAAAKGRISFKLTTPDEFKAIAGRPTREWTDDDLICMEYPGIEVKFFGKPEIIPHTLVFVSCEGRGIDIGQDRPIVLRNEGDLDNFGSFWGYSSVDLSRLDLSKKGKLLKAMTFDSRTVWPEPDFLPPDFDPKAVMEWGKYPGLRVKQLHDRGVTGKGVHVAIIDQPLLLGHIEYRDQLVSYKEIETGNADPQMHGPPVASILVGKTCGVAPEAILHYWAEPSWKGDYKYRCIALEQIIQYNREKTKSEQIRVVSVSKGFSLSEPNLDRWKALLEKAKQSGIYVVHCSSMGFGAGCRFLEDSDNPASYRLCAFYRGGDVYRQSGTFFTPIDHRTTASEKARDAYTFWTRGGLSWGAPYYAGVVALGIQVNPDLRPDQIDKLLYDSGWDFQKGRLINPVGFVEAAQKAD